MTRPADTTPTGLAARDVAASIAHDLHAGRITFRRHAAILRRLERTDPNPQRADLTRAVRVALVALLRGPAGWRIAG